MTKLYLPLGILVHHLKQIVTCSVEICPLVHRLRDDVHVGPVAVEMLEVGALARPDVALHEDSEGSGRSGSLDERNTGSGWRSFLYH